MNTYAILRKQAWQSAEELELVAKRSIQVAEDDFPSDIRWIRSYVLRRGRRHTGKHLHLPGHQSGGRA